MHKSTLAAVLAIGLLIVVLPLIFKRDSYTGLQFLPKASTTNKDFAKRFAYYVLTEKCLSEHLKLDRTLGDGVSCDVYVNSYRWPCKTNTLPHVTYIYDNQTTWSSGRNLLLHHVRRSAKSYKYHIFLDDDVSLFYTEHFIEFANKNKVPVGSAEAIKKYINGSQGYNKAILETRDGKSAWRAFEQDLLDNSPAIAVTNVYRTSGHSSRLTQLSYWTKMCPQNKPMPWITTTYYMDPIFIAYKDEAIPLFLPYSTSYDKQSWRIAGLLETFRARAILPRQNICNYRFSVINQAHRPYPHNTLPNDILIKYIDNEAPELRGLIDDRELDDGSIQIWYQLENKLFHDKSICLKPLKFGVEKFYRIRLDKTNN